MSQEQLNLHISITDICDLVIKTNQKYAEVLEKPIQFQKNVILTYVLTMYMLFYLY